MGTSRSLRRRARSAAALAGAVTLLGSLAVSQAPAASAGVLPSTTTLSVSPSASYVGTTVSMTATVSLLGLPGLGVTPTGTVTFQYDSATAHQLIGTSSLGSCLLTTCTVSRASSTLPVGTGTITATYNGDTFLAASSASSGVTVSYPPEPPPAQSSSNGCAAGQSCSTQTIQTTNGANTDSLTVTAGPSTGSQSVSGSLTPGESLSCPREPGDSDPGQALATFTNTGTGPGASKSVLYRVDGPASVTISNNYSNSTDRLVCFASTTPFDGWSPSGYGPAPLYTSPYGQQFYEAELGSCVNHSGYRPCFSLNNGSALPSPFVEITVNTQPGDPKIYP